MEKSYARNGATRAMLTPERLDSRTNTEYHQANPYSDLQSIWVRRVAGDRDMPRCEADGNYGPA